MTIKWGRIGLALIFLFGCIATAVIGLNWSAVQSALKTQATAIANQPTSAPVQPTVAPKATTAPAQPTVAPNKPTVPAQPVVKPLGKIRVAYPSFVTYQANAIAKELSEDVDVELVQIGLNGKNDWDEPEQAKQLADGTIDILLTTKEKGVIYPQMGKIVYPGVDETAGGDYINCRLNSVNEIGKTGKTKIAYTDGSISMYLVFGTLDLINLPVDRVTLAPKPNLKAATVAYINKEVDCVAGWVSPEMDATDAVPGNKMVISTENFRLAMDSIYASNKAIAEKPAAVVAYLKAYARAANLMWDDPKKATELIKKTDPTGDWTGITSVDDLNSQLATVAPATWSQNVLICKDQKRFVARLAEDKAILIKYGVKAPDQKPEDLVNCNFVLAIADSAAKDSVLAQQLKNTEFPPNPTFNYVGGVEMPKLNEATKVQTYATTEVIFQPNSRVLTKQDQEKLLELVRKLEKFSNTYFKVSAMAALPPGDNFDRPSTLQFAADRVVAVTDFLKVNGIPENRIIVGEGAEKKYPGALEPAHPRAATEDLLKLDRKAVVEIVTTGR